MTMITRSMMKRTLRCDGCTMTKPEHLFHFVDDFKFCDTCDYEPTDSDYDSECESQCECINGFTCECCELLEAVHAAEAAVADAEHELEAYMESKDPDELEIIKSDRSHYDAPHVCFTCGYNMPDYDFKEGKMCCDKPLFHDEIASASESEDENDAPQSCDICGKEGAGIRYGESWNYHFVAEDVSKVFCPACEDKWATKKNKKKCASFGECAGTCWED